MNLCKIAVIGRGINGAGIARGTERLAGGR